MDEPITPNQSSRDRAIAHAAQLLADNSTENDAKFHVLERNDVVAITWLIGYAYHVPDPPKPATAAAAAPHPRRH